MSGRIRSIKPEVLEDELAAGLSDAAWRLWVSSWVLADDHGNFRAGDRYLAANVWQDTGRDVAEARQELIDRGFISPYAVDGQRYAHINGWSKHQRVDNAGKPRVPPPEHDDGTWDQPLSPVLAQNRANRGEPTQDSAKREEPGESPPRACARARIPAAGPTITISTTEPDHDRDRARAREETPTGSTVPKTEPVVLSEPQDRKPDGALPDGLVHFERKAWIEAYQDAVNAGAKTPKDDPWTLPEKKFNALRKIVETRCRGESRKNIAEWIRAEVSDFVRAILALNQDPEKFWNDYDPDGLQRWHNRQRPGLVRRQTPGPRKAPYQPPLEQPSMSREETAAYAQAGLDMLKRGETGPRPK